MYGSVVFARWRWYAPHLIHASLGPPESKSQMASRAVQPFLDSSPHRVAILYNWPPVFPLNIASSHGDPNLHLIHGSVGPPESSTQIASRLLQPFLHSSMQCIPILCSGTPLPPLQNCPFPWETWTPPNAWFCGLIQAHKQNSISVGSVDFAQLTTVRDRPTDHATRSVTIGHIYIRSMAMQRSNNDAKCTYIHLLAV